MNPRNTVLLALALAGCVAAGPPRPGAPVFSPGGPFPERYATSGTYAAADRSNWFLQQRHNVDGFSRADGIWPANFVQRGPQVRAWQRAPLEPAGVDIDSYLERNPVTGLLLAQGDTIHLERYQYGRTDAHRLTSFSMAKTVTSMLVGIALDEGRIGSLDDLPERYVPGFRGTEYGKTPLRHLLTMSSGVEWAADAGGVPPYLRLVRATVEQGTAGGAAGVREWNRRLAAPGKRWNYADGETVVLGLVLQAATGRKLADYLSEKIWQPMGAEAEASWLLDASGAEVATGFFNAVLRDYARFGMLLANGGNAGGRQLIPAAWLREATRAHYSGFETGRWYGYGYQAWIFPDNDGSFALLGLGGQAIYVDPARRLVMVNTAVRSSRDPTSETVALWQSLRRLFPKATQ